VFNKAQVDESIEEALKTFRMAPAINMGYAFVIVTLLVSIMLGCCMNKSNWSFLITPAAELQGIQGKPISR